MSAMGKAIRKARLAAGLSNQEKLAKVTGFSVSSVANWESGRTRPGKDAIDKLADVIKFVAPAIMKKKGPAKVTKPSKALPGKKIKKVMSKETKAKIAATVKARHAAKKPQAKPDCTKCPEQQGCIHYFVVSGSETCRKLREVRTETLVELLKGFVDANISDPTPAVKALIAKTVDTLAKL